MQSGSVRHMNPISNGAIAPDQFRRAMRNVPAAVAIVSAEHEGRYNGITITAVGAVSAEPPQVLVCINRQASVHGLIVASRRFTINFLRDEQEEMARRFSQAGLDGQQRFASGNWCQLASGSRVLVDALVYFECDVVASHQHGTHTLMIGRVVASNVAEGHALMYCDGRYRKKISGV